MSPIKSFALKCVLDSKFHNLIRWALLLHYLTLLQFSVFITSRIPSNILKSVKTVDMAESASLISEQQRLLPSLVPHIQKFLISSSEDNVAT